MSAACAVAENESSGVLLSVYAPSDYSFVRRWRPEFIGTLAAEDHCHLNGLAMVDAKPKYLSALGARQFGNQLATALPLRPQRDYNANRCGIAANGFVSSLLQRQPSDYGVAMARRPARLRSP
jgi:hypothetical protein